MKYGKSLRLTLTFLTLTILLIVDLLPGSSFADEISAKAAIVMNADNKQILYAKNSDVRMYPASTTKLMTSIVALENIAPETILTVSKKAAATPSVSPQLKAGERYSVRALLYLALMRSVNSAAVALAEGVSGSEDAFAKMMNKKLKSLGAKDTRFINASGLPGEGQFITVFDLALIMKKAANIALIREIMGTRVKVIYSEGGRRIFVKNTNHLLWADENMIGGKTGYTNAARHCFVSVARNGRSEIIIAVLGVPQRNNLWNETAALLHKNIEVAAIKEKRDKKEGQFANVSFKVGR